MKTGLLTIPEIDEFGYEIIENPSLDNIKRDINFIEPNLPTKFSLVDSVNVGSLGKGEVIELDKIFNNANNPSFKNDY